MSLINPLKEEARAEQTANNNSIDSVDECPVCQKKMLLREVNRHNCYVCLEHRIVLPCPNE